MIYFRENKLNIIASFILMAVILMNIATYQFPFLHEDEAIYIKFSLNPNPSLESGYAWKYLLGSLWNSSSADPLRLYPLYVNDNLKILVLIIGFLCVSTFILITRCYLKLENYLTFTLASMFMLDPVFISQAHRLRPEILHTFFAIASLYFFSKISGESKKEIFLNKNFALGALFMALIPHTHMMSYPHVLGILTFCFFNILRLSNKISYAFISLLILGIIAIATLIPIAQLIIGMINQPRFNTQAEQIGFLEAFRMTFSSYINWFVDVPVKHIGEEQNLFFQNAHHLKTLGKVTIIFSILCSFAVVVKSIFEKKNSKNLALATANLAVIFSFIISIMVFKRINNSYLILLSPWLLIGVSSILTDFKNNKLKCAINYGTYVFFALFLFIATAHYLKFVYPFKDSNFNNILSKSRKELEQQKCGEVKIVSMPYTPFISIHARDYSDYLKDPKINIANDTKSNECILVTAKHYYGYEYFNQFDSKTLRKTLSENFELVSKFESKFFKNDPLYPHRKLKEEINLTYSIGADYNGAGGKETIFLFKRKTATGKPTHK